MRLLVLGGGVFLGRHVVEAACARGHEVSVFNRGLHNEGLPSEVERLVGDRQGDLSALANRRWDAAVDTCGFYPSVVRRSASSLADAAGTYLFVSSASVYPEFRAADFDESAPVGTLSEEQFLEAEADAAAKGATVVNRLLYGPLKALCERAAEDSMPGRVLSVRPGLIVGPGDPTGRFTYWVRRVAARPWRRAGRTAASSSSTPAIWPRGS